MDSATIVQVQLRGNFSQPLLDQFITLYNNAFPDPSEREDPAQWRERLCNELAAPQPRLHLELAVIGGESAPQVIAGLAFEYYKDSNCGLLTYLVVDANHRRAGLARRLADAAIVTLQRQAKAQRLDAVFSEVEDPALMPATGGPIAPADRVRAMARLGARWVDIPYVQPQLVGGNGRSHHLLLLTFPLDGALPKAASVRAFLHEFYRALDVADPEADADFQKISAVLKGGIRCGRFEMPTLALENVAVALHFVEYAPPVLQERGTYPANPTFNSMELDLLAYQFQERPPLGSRYHGAGSLPLTITFPTQLTYVSEGRTEALRTSQPLTQATVSLSSTRFLDSGLRIWHVVIRPAPGNFFDEYTLIKLIHLYDGRAESTILKQSGQVRFAVSPPAGGAPLICQGADLLLTTLRGIYNRGSETAPLTAGTVQIVTGSTRHDRLIRYARQARDGGGQKIFDVVKGWVEGGTSEGRALKAYGGIATGIFDFAEVDTEELLDTFEPTFTDADLFIRINRGTVLQMTPRDRAAESVIDTIGISPYLIVPHALLLHNEELVKRAEQEVDAVLRDDTANVLVWEEARQSADLKLRYYHLPNIFNYKTERTLFERGAVERGSQDRREDVLEKLDELNERIKASWLRRQDRGRAWVAALLAVFSALQSREIFKAFDVGAILAIVLSLAVAGVVCAVVMGIGLHGVRKSK